MNLYKKLIAIQSDLKAPKGQFNGFGKYNYRNCEDILEALKPILKQNDCAVMIKDEIVALEGRFYVKATVTFIDAETGENTETTAFAREEESKKGMDGSQVTGASSSYARKYALNGMFAIDDTKDADGTNDNGKGKQEPKQEPKADLPKITDAQVKRAYTLASSAGISNNDVKVWIKAKFDKDSTKDLIKTEYEQLCESLENKIKVKQAQEQADNKSNEFLDSVGA